MLARDLQLLFQPLLYGLLLQQVFDARGHLVERLRQLAELIVRSDRDLVVEISLLHPLRADEELVHRPGDRPRQRKPHEEGHELNDEEHDADEGHGEEQKAADAERADAGRRRNAVVDLGRADADRHREVARCAAVPVDEIEKRDPWKPLLQAVRGGRGAGRL